jgi:HEAT repeat protein
VNIKVAEFSAGLRDPRLEARLKAAEGLANLRGPGRRKAVPDLMRALDDPNPKLRELALITLGGIGEDSKPAVPKVIAVMKDKQLSENLRWQAAACLQFIGPAAEDAVPVLLCMLDTEKGLPRYGAVNALVTIVGDKDARVVPALLKLLDDPDGQVHSAAARALGRIGKCPEKVVPALVAMLEKNRPSPDDREMDPASERVGQCLAAILALGQFGAAAEKAVPALIQVVKERKELPILRRAAIETLGAIGPKAKEAMPVLQAIAESRADRGFLEGHAKRAVEAISRTAGGTP